MVKYLAEVHGDWLPVYAESLEEALEAVSAEYGEDNIGRVKMEVTHVAE